jgi:hypothetical protein
MNQRRPPERWSAWAWRYLAATTDEATVAETCDALRAARGVPDDVFQRLLEAMARTAARRSAPRRHPRVRPCERCMELAADSMPGTWRRRGWRWHLCVTAVPECEQPAGVA